MINPLKIAKSLRRGGNLSSNGSQSCRALVPHSMGRRRKSEMPSEMHSVVIAFDSSPSTYANKAVDQIAEGSGKLVYQIRKDGHLSKRLEFAVFGFGKEQPVERYVDFTPATKFEMPKIRESYGTWLYEINLDCVDAALNRRQELSEHHDADTPSAWFFFFSDFQSTCDTHRDEAIKLNQQVAEEVNVFIIGCGDACDERVMAELAQPGRPPVMMQSELNFLEFFEWLGKSLGMKSRSMPGQQLLLDDLCGTSLKAEG